MIGGLMKTTSYLAIATAASLMLGGAVLAPKAARAADLGGDCCADLEGRVAELEATTVRKGYKKVSLTITGRVAATMTFWSDGGGTDPDFVTDTNQDLYFGDHSGNGPQIILKGEGKISSDLSGGFYIELNPNSITGGTHSDTEPDLHVGSGDTQISHVAPGGNVGTSNTYVYLNSKHLGQLQLGHTDNAGDEYFANFNGSWVAGEEAGRFTSLSLRDVTGDLTLTSYGANLSTLEPGGEDGLRYISPDFNGFSFGASVAGDTNWGVGANYSGTFHTVSIKAGVGYAARSELDGILDPNNANYLGLSAGIKESGSGLFLEGQWSKKTFNIAGRTDATDWLIEGGWAKNVSGAGDLTIWGAYNRNDSVAFSGVAAHDFQIGVDQAVDSAAMHLFLTYENDSLDSSYIDATDDVALVNPQSSSSVTAGASISF